MPTVPRSALLAEFVLCAVIVGLSPATDRHHDDTAADWMARASAVCGLFFLLSVLSSAGGRSARIAAGFGGLVTLTLLVSERDVFTALARRLTPAAKPPGGELGATADSGQIGGAAGGGTRFGPDTTAPRPGRPAPA
jgi:hypothetical protein